MSHNKLIEHSRYVLDDVRTEAYRTALAAVVTPDSVVMDLGAGTGILGLLAAQAGARHVYAVEEGPIAALASQIVEASGYSDRITIIAESSLTAELPEPADVVVCDQLFGAVIEAQMPRLLADARRRHLRPDGALMPCRYIVKGAPVEMSSLNRRITRLQNTEHLDLQPLVTATVNTVAQCNDNEVSPLAKEATLIGPVDTDDMEARSGEAAFNPTAGRIDGIALTWEAELASGVWMSNGGDHPIDRAVAILPLHEPTTVSNNDTLVVALTFRPRLGLVDWQVSLNGESGRKQSTFLGSLLRNRDVAPPTGEEETGAPLNTVATLLAAGADAATIEASVWSSHAGVFPSRETAARFVNEALGLQRHLRAE